MSKNTQDKRAPFGVTTKRFCPMGFHPGLDPSGAMKKPITKSGPGSYNPVASRCMNKTSKDVWMRKLKSEVWSKNLGYHLPQKLAERKFFASMGGPAVTIVDPDFFKIKSDLVKENCGFGYQKRFFVSKNDGNVPPPNLYYWGTTNKLSTIGKKRFNDTPHMLFDVRPRFKDDSPSYHLGPAKYNVKDHNGIEETCTKSHSKRRPLEMFTLPRDYTSIKNHFGLGNVQPKEQFVIPLSDLDYLLKNPVKKRNGKFLKAERWLRKPVVREMLNDFSLCYRDPDFPSPATYDTTKYKSIKLFGESKYPFNCSNINIRPPINWEIRPGVGRYTPKEATCKAKPKGSWPFLTKVKRGETPKNEYSDY